MASSAVAKALTRASRAAEELPLPAAEARIVVFSDLHKGVRDGADDFLRCEPGYCAALAWYFEKGYSLYVLGDAEELWENDPEPVLRTGTGYPEVLELEAAFHRDGRYERFFGNHDDLWSHSGAVSKHLEGFFPGLKVREALKLRLTRPGARDGLMIFLHGHQGTSDSDRWRWISRLFVRYVWRPIQRKSGYTGVTPARDYKLRAEHDRAMSAWAGSQAEQPVLITGHTHRPVFWDSTPDPPPAAAGRRGRRRAARRPRVRSRAAARSPDGLHAPHALLLQHRLLLLRRRGRHWTRDRRRRDPPHPLAARRRHPAPQGARPQEARRGARRGRRPPARARHRGGDPGVTA